jgi:hypothetical protein
MSSRVLVAFSYQCQPAAVARPGGHVLVHAGAGQLLRRAAAIGSQAEDAAGVVRSELNTKKRPSALATGR